MSSKTKYSIVSFILFVSTILVLSFIDKTSNIKLSLVIEFIMMLYIVKISWGCILYIKKQYKKHKYSYTIVMNLGLLVFLIINLFRHINLLFNNWNLTSINDIYENTLNSFSYFAYLFLPLIIILAIYSVITNIILIIKEGFKIRNLLGIVFGIGVVFLTLTSQLIFELNKNVQFLNSHIYIKRFIDIGTNSVICYFYCITVSTLYCNIMAANHVPEFDKDYIIILGARIRDDGTLTPILKARVDKAIEFAKKQEEFSKKKIVFVPSGGQGPDETMSEAAAMRNYLIQNGIDAENIIIEDHSTSTSQNLKYSKDIIDNNNKNGKIVFSTTNYHVFRSGIIANNEGIDCEGIGAKTKWYFYTNALIREFGAGLISERKRHLGLVLIINISLFILIFIGYKYNLI